MSKIDEVKEILNTLRIAMSISFGVLLVTVAGLINRLDSNNIDVVFWAGIIFSALMIVVILILFIMISNKTKKIGVL